MAEPVTLVAEFVSKTADGDGPVVLEAPEVIKVWPRVRTDECSHCQPP